MLTSLELAAAIDKDDVESLLDDARSGACALWSSSSYAHAPAISDWKSSVFTDGSRFWIGIRGLFWSGSKISTVVGPWRTTGVRWIDCRRRWCITTDGFFRLGKQTTYRDDSDD
jgi:hypothetical protein